MKQTIILTIKQIPAKSGTNNLANSQKNGLLATMLQTTKLMSPTMKQIIKEIRTKIPMTTTNIYSKIVSLYHLLQRLKNSSSL